MKQIWNLKLVSLQLICRKLKVQKQRPFYFYVYCEGSPPAEEPYGIYAGELPQFYKFPFPMEISLYYEMQGNKKRVV